MPERQIVLVLRRRPRPRFSGKAGDQAAGRPAKPRTKDEDDDEGRWEGKSEEAIQEYIHDFDV
jgi:hypothetical protein